MEIITAGDGTAHVSSADDGTIYAGIAGNGCYVTGVGDRLSCTMQGANTALVGTGVGIMYGRAFRVAMPEEVTIQSGTQSQRRNDVICAHFTTSSGGRESGGLVVLKGTPTSKQKAEDPVIPSGDILQGATEAYMPLWRIPLDGINVGKPEAMFSVLMSMSKLQSEIAGVRNSVSKQPRIFVGSGVWSCSAAKKYVQMWTRQQFVDKFGSAFNNFCDCIVAMNGDAAAQGYGNVLGCYYDNGIIGCYIDGHVDGFIRLNYAVFLN